MTDRSYEGRADDPYARDPYAREEPRVGEPSLSQLFSELAREASTLVRKEVQLARTEMSEKTSQVTSGITSMAGGGAVLFLGAFFLAFAAMIGLAYVMPDWAAALAVGVALAIVGGIMLAVARRNLAARNLKPQRTVETLREDARWAKEQVR